MAKTKKTPAGSGSIGTGLGDEKVIIVVSGSSSAGLGDEKLSNEVLGKQYMEYVAKQKLPSTKLTVVFPYLKEKAQGIELQMALRALDCNFREDFQVVVIGDAEPWFSNEVIHIAADVVSDNPQVDTIHKLKLAISDENVSDKFIWMNDDIYMISPVMIPDIQVLTAQGKLAYIAESKSIYDINRNKTIELLKSIGSKGAIPLHNYDTHTPFFYEKEKLVALFEELEELNSEGLLIPSIYYNMYYPEFTPMQFDGINGHYQLRIKSKNTDKATFDKFIVGKKFLNNSELGYNKVLVDYLESKFQSKSRFEK